MSTSIVIAPDIDGAVREVAERFAAAYDEALEDHAMFFVSMAGGATPRALYGLLASPLWQARINWTKVRVYWGDERYVPRDDPRSNARMVRETLLDRVLVLASGIRPIPTADRDPAEAAEKYERTLREELPGGTDGRPRFDLVLLGLGNDGHTASLFPGSKALHEEDRLVASVEPPDAPTPRITLTPPILNAAAHVIVLTAGNLKAGALSAALDRDRTADDIPARILQPVHGDLTWVADADAAARIDPARLDPGVEMLRA